MSTPARIGSFILVGSLLLSLLSFFETAYAAAFALNDRVQVISVPLHATNLRFVTSGGVGDSDLFAQFGTPPIGKVFDAKSDGPTTEETIAIPAPQAGIYYLLVSGYKAYSKVSLVGTYVVPST